MEESSVRQCSQFLQPLCFYILLRCDAAVQAYLHLVGLYMSKKKPTLDDAAAESDAEGSEGPAPEEDLGAFQLDRDFSIERRVLPPITLGRGGFLNTIFS